MGKEDRMDRREFLGTSVGLLGGIVSGLRTGVLQAAPAGRLEQIGLQLYTVRELMRQDFEGTLGKVASIGYKQVEFAGYYDRTPEQIRALLDRLGLEAPATHISLASVRGDLEGLIRTATVIGHRYLVVPSIPRSERESLDAYRRIADLFNRAAERCRQEGVGFAYHNHAFEFERIDGQLPFDVLLEETDSDLVKMEIDLFWIRRGGQDPLSYFARFPGRFALCHVKDMDSSGNMVDVGSGAIDFAKIFARSEQAGLKYYIVEHDRPASPIENIRSSYEHLRQLRF